MNSFHRWYCHTAHWRHTVEERLLPWMLDGAELGPDVLEVAQGPASRPTCSPAACPG